MLPQKTRRRNGNAPGSVGILALPMRERYKQEKQFALSKRFRGEMIMAGEVVAIKESPREYHKDLSWYKSLAQVKQKTVIVYLALHGGADAEGKQPYLLPQEADVCEPDKRVWLRDILAQLAEIGDDKN